MAKFKKGTVQTEGFIEVLVPNANFCIKCVKALHNLEAVHDLLINHIDLFENKARMASEAKDCGTALERCNDATEFIKTILNTFEEEDEDDEDNCPAG